MPISTDILHDYQIMLRFSVKDQLDFSQCYVYDSHSQNNKPCEWAIMDVTSTKNKLVYYMSISIKIFDSKD